MAYANGRIMDAGEAAATLATKGKNTNSIMEGWVDRGPWVYWDTITAVGGAALASTYSPFSVPIGAQNPLIANTTKNKYQTNMVRGNEFPPPRCLLLQAIGFYFSSTMLKADIDAVLDGCYMEFRIDEKVFHEGHLQLFPAGAGLSGIDNNSGKSAYTNGLPAPEYSRRYFEWSKYIAPLQQFSMTLIFPGTPPTMSGDNTAPGLNMHIYLDGLTDRSVQ